MGGGQSHERTSLPEVEERVVSSSAPHDSQIAPASDASTREEPDPETPAQLPQCQMGNRKVDDMSHMISCTNWY